MTDPKATDDAARPTLLERNIDKIARLEHASLGERSRGERIGRSVIRTVGTPKFFVLHGILFLGWVAWNSAAVLRGAYVFDPYPYPILELVATLEAIFLALLILISQNRLQRESDHRAHLNLQINMLAELEGTKIIQMLQGISEQLHLKGLSDDQMDELKRETDPERLAESIRRQIPSEDS